MKSNHVRHEAGEQIYKGQQKSVQLQTQLQKKEKLLFQLR